MTHDASRFFNFASSSCSTITGRVITIPARLSCTLKSDQSSSHMRDVAHMQPHQSQMTENSCEAKCASANCRVSPNQRQHRQDLDFTYWSSTPSVAASLRGPWISWCWSNASDPDSQGIRERRSSRVDMTERILALKIGRGGSNLSSIGHNSFELDGFDVHVERVGREDAVMKPSRTNRIVMNVIKPYCKIRQNADENLDRLSVLDAFVLCLFSERRPNFSRRLLVSTSISSPVAFGSILALTTSTSFVMPPHMNQPSQTLPPMELPRMLSAMTSATRVRRQAFSRSSVGSSTARAPCTKSCLYSASCSCCSVAVEGTAALGTGESAG